MRSLSVTKVYQLGLMTVAYIVGELTHFLINTTSKAQVNKHYKPLSAVKKFQKVILQLIPACHSGAGYWLRGEVLLQQCDGCGLQ